MKSPEPVAVPALPASVHLIQMAVGGWVAVLEVALARRDRLTLRLDGRPTTFDAQDVDAKLRAFGAIAPAFFRLTVPGVRTLVDEVAAAAGIEPLAACAGELCTWAMLDEMRASGVVEIGCHTVNHANLANESPADAYAEMADARARIAHQLGAAPRHFAYPYGKPDHASGREFLLAREVGFATAVTTRKASLFGAHRDHLYSLPRVEVSPNFAASPHYLRTVLSGLPLLAWNRGRRVIVH